MSHSNPSRFISINQKLVKFLLFTFPLAAFTAIISLYFPQSEYFKTGLMELIYDVLGWHIIIWFIALINFILTLFLSTEFREKFLSRVTKSEERDEREAYLAGRASKSTFYSTLSALILLFFLTGLNITLVKEPATKEQERSGKVTIGYKFELTKKMEKDEATGIEYLNFKGLPLTTESIILLLIMFHILSYHFYNRKISIED